jgi:hypothetical protein
MVLILPLGWLRIPGACKFKIQAGLKPLHLFENLLEIFIPYLMCTTNQRWCVNPAGGQNRPKPSCARHVLDRTLQAYPVAAWPAAVEMDVPLRFMLFLYIRRPVVP